MKTCCKCKTEKSLDNFWADKRAKDGKQKSCIECQKEKNRLYSESHREYFKIKGKERYEQTKHLNPERYQKYKNKFLECRKNWGTSLTGKFTTLLYSAKTRAEKKNLDYDLDYEWISDKYKEQDGKCFMTGITFTFDSANYGSKRYNPYSPSLDRINPSKGYTRENTRLVCTHINIALNEFGEELFEDLVLKFLSHKGYTISRG